MLELRNHHDYGNASTRASNSSFTGLAQAARRSGGMSSRINANVRTQRE